MTDTTTAATICLLRQGRGLDFNRYVERTFSSAETAHRYRNSQPRNVNIAVVSRKVRKGDVVSPTERTRGLV